MRQSLAASVALSRFQQNGPPAINELFAETPGAFLPAGQQRHDHLEGDGGRIDRLVVEAGAQRRIATRRK